MNIEKIRSRKALKFLGLLISAMVIAAVSAQVYSYMYITGKGAVSTGTGLKWVAGADAPNGTSIVGNTVSDVNMTVNDGNPKNYTDCLRIVNQDPTTAHNFSLEVTKSPSTVGDKANFTEFNLVLFDESNVTQAVLDLKTQGSNATGLTIPGGETWRVLFELVPISTPTDGATVEFEVKLTYESAA